MVEYIDTLKALKALKELGEMREVSKRDKKTLEVLQNGSYITHLTRPEHEILKSILKQHGRSLPKYEDLIPPTGVGSQVYYSLTYHNGALVVTRQSSLDINKHYRFAVFAAGLNNTLKGETKSKKKTKYLFND